MKVIGRVFVRLAVREGELRYGTNKSLLDGYSACESVVSWVGGVKLGDLCLLGMFGWMSE